MEEGETEAHAECPVWLGPVAESAGFERHGSVSLEEERRKGRKLELRGQSTTTRFWREKCHHGVISLER